MTSDKGRRPALILPELAGMVVLASISLSLLLLASGVEFMDRVFYGQRPPTEAFRVDPAVALDYWLHLLARLLFGLGLLNVAVRRAKPVLMFRLVMAKRTAHAPVAGTELHRLAAKYDRLESIRVLSREPGPVAFTQGLLYPRVYVSQAILDVLSARELELLLLHEIEHCRARDPLRSFTATLLADFFFWLPVVPRLQDRVMSKIEFAADDAAAGLDPGYLAQTILKVAGLNAPRLTAGVSFADDRRLPARVRRLIGVNVASSGDTLTPRSLQATVVVLLALATLGLTVYGTHSEHHGTEEGSAQVSCPSCDSPQGEGVLLEGPY